MKMKDAVKKLFDVNRIVEEERKRLMDVLAKPVNKRIAGRWGSYFPAEAYLERLEPHTADLYELATGEDVNIGDDDEDGRGEAIIDTIDIDDEIPVDAFAAVSEILAYVYRASAAMPPLADEPPTDPAPP